jgi:hypothetical protein
MTQFVSEVALTAYLRNILQTNPTDNDWLDLIDEWGKIPMSFMAFRTIATFLREHTEWAFIWVRDGLSADQLVEAKFELEAVKDHPLNEESVRMTYEIVKAIYELHLVSGLFRDDRFRDYVTSFVDEHVTDARMNYAILFGNHVQIKARGMQLLRTHRYVGIFILVTLGDNLFDPDIPFYEICMDPLVPVARLPLFLDGSTRYLSSSADITYHVDDTEETRAEKRARKAARHKQGNAKKVEIFRYLFMERTKELEDDDNKAKKSDKSAMERCLAMMKEVDIPIEIGREVLRHGLLTLKGVPMSIFITKMYQMHGGARGDDGRMISEVYLHRYEEMIYVMETAPDDVVDRIEYFVGSGIDGDFRDGEVRGLSGRAVSILASRVFANPKLKERYARWATPARLNDEMNSRIIMIGNHSVGRKPQVRLYTYAIHDLHSMLVPKSVPHYSLW